MQKIHHIHIEGASNGILVTVGCMAPFVYAQKDLNQFLTDLSAYLSDPKATQKVIFERWGIEEPISQPEQPLAVAEERPRPTVEREGMASRDSRR